ncbi:response regulator transcription factor [Bartonella choladocola]|uniref:Response regulator RstA, two-component system n=1 Tax=Bartonella choladocola TaxID=2750995 RepID=A0A1U9MJC4_9HYPH|nr:response regulator transcription factor [Bartonella choladocola]AQT47956.1 response regulator RstA, two-component system [Bartonella choladocola]
MSGKILIVEDDVELADGLMALLKCLPYEIKVHHRGNTAEEIIHDFKPDLIILDIGLPGKSGLEICEAIRPHFHGAIFIYTSYDDNQDQIIGFGVDADSYISKLEDPKVLVSRIESKMRRLMAEALSNRQNLSIESEKNFLRIGSLTIDPDTKEATIDGVPLPLTSNEKVLLYLFATKINIALDRDYLSETVLGKPYSPEDRSVDVAVNRLNQKLKSRSGNCGEIVSKRGIGYIYAYNLPLENKDK